MNVLENLLVTLMEECSEVAKAASKILRAGPDSTVPGRSTTNLQELQAELDDVQGVLMELRANGLDVVVRNPAAVVKKREKLRHYIGVSRQLGFVQGPLAAGETWPGIVIDEPTKHPGLALATGVELDYFARQHGLIREVDEPDSSLRERVSSGKPFATLDPSLLRSAKDFAAQYQCTPVSTVKKVIDTLLNESSYSRDYLQELPLKELLFALRQYPQHRDLYRELRRHINNLPETNEWIKHDGGPCPVRHEEVEVVTRSMFGTNTSRRAMPESFNWHWGRPGVDATPIDVLQWRKV